MSSTSFPGGSTGAGSVSPPVPCEPESLESEPTVLVACVAPNTKGVFDSVEAAEVKLVMGLVLSPWKVHERGALFSDDLRVNRLLLARRLPWELTESVSSYLGAHACSQYG